MEIDADCSGCGEAPVSDLKRMLCDDCAWAADFLGDLADTWE